MAYVRGSPALSSFGGRHSSTKRDAPSGENRVSSTRAGAPSSFLTDCTGELDADGGAGSAAGSGGGARLHPRSSAASGRERPTSKNDRMDRRRRWVWMNIIGRSFAG